MTPRRIVITGAAGFVGQHMLRACRTAWPDTWLAAACRSSDVPGRDLPGFDAVVPFDLMIPSSIEAAVADTRPDVVVHLAACADVAASFQDPDSVWAANLGGGRALAAAMARFAPDAVLLHAGSAEVYGLSFQSGAVLDEMGLLQPANPYAASKAAIDLALGEMSLRGLRVIRMRPLNHVGPGQSPSYAVASFARQIALIELGRQAPVIRTGALDRARDFLDARDVCAAYVAAISRAEALEPDAIFNLASEHTRKIGDVLDELLRQSTVDVRVDSTAVTPRPLDIMATRCSAAMARRVLDWRPEIPWETTLADTLAFWRTIS